MGRIRSTSQHCRSWSVCPQRSLELAVSCCSSDLPPTSLLNMRSIYTESIVLTPNIKKRPAKRVLYWPSGTKFRSGITEGALSPVTLPSFLDRPMNPLALDSYFRYAFPYSAMTSSQLMDLLMSRSLRSFFVDFWQTSNAFRKRSEWDWKTSILQMGANQNTKDVSRTRERFLGRISFQRQLQELRLLCTEDGCWTLCCCFWGVS